jgi:hypothetical protein
MNTTQGSSSNTVNSREILMHSRSLVSLAVLSTLVLCDASFGAPKPTRPPIVQPYRPTPAQLQQMRFQAAGLTIPPVPANGGLCIIEIGGAVGPPAGQQGASGSNRLYEIQTWMVSPTPMQTGAVPLSYAVTWNSVGNGARHDDNGVGTVNDWKFGISGGANTQLTARKNPSGAWLVQVTPTSAQNAVAVTQQQTVSGRPNAPGTAMTADYSVGAPGMTFAPVAGTAPNMPVHGTQSYSWSVPQQVGWGYPMPGYAMGNINCTWNLTVGP